VVIGDIDGMGAEKTVATIRDKGGQASCLCVDVTKSADVQHMVMSAVDQYGGLDYAFNNAGFVGSTAGVVETSEEDWQRVVATNLRGVWLCMKYEILEMLKRGGGAIVNNGSVVGLVGTGFAIGSVATKHGVSGLTKSAALEYTTQGIRVNAVAPGMVRTPLADRMMKALQPGAEAAMLSVVPQGRWCEPEEIAEVVVFLCSDGCLACHRTRHADRRRLDGKVATAIDERRYQTVHPRLRAPGPSAPRPQSSTLEARAPSPRPRTRGGRIFPVQYESHRIRGRTDANSANGHGRSCPRSRRTIRRMEQR
jgi:NAD(P)-dependent dehydrogenase (short-subunit alcohol dehydrogenase family)